MSYAKIPQPSEKHQHAFLTGAQQPSEKHQHAFLIGAQHHTRNDNV
jgi:hypothetical protein